LLHRGFTGAVIVSVMAEEKDVQAAVEKKGRKPWTLREFGGKTVWDWLQLLGVLAIPVVIAVGGCMFNVQQNDRQNALEDRRARQAQKIENQRAEAERELAGLRSSVRRTRRCKRTSIR
jgi:uncharacterized protein HemX